MFGVRADDSRRIRRRLNLEQFPRHVCQVGSLRVYLDWHLVIYRACGGAEFCCCSESGLACLHLFWVAVRG